MKTISLKQMFTVMLLMVTAVCVADSLPRQVKVKAVTGFRKAAATAMKAPRKVVIGEGVSRTESILGDYTATAANQDGESWNPWPVNITVDDYDAEKVWISNLSPKFYHQNYSVPTYNYFYGALNGDKTKLHVPVGQAMNGTYSFTAGGVEYNNKVVQLGAYDEFGCEEGYINVHSDDIVFRIENHGASLVLEDTVFVYHRDENNGSFWLIDQIMPGMKLSKDGVVLLEKAGTLSTKISGSERELNIIGPLNGADLKVLRDMSVNKNLLMLDMEYTTIVGGNTTVYYSDYTVSTSNVLPKYLFYKSNLESIVLPYSITKIEDSALGYMLNLAELTIPAKVTSISSTSFSRNSSLIRFKVENGNTSFTTYSDVLYSYDGKTLVKYPEGKSGTSYTVRNGTTTLASNALAYVSLTSVSLPSSLTTIAGSAFSQSKLQSLLIPASVRTIYSTSFSAMTALKKFSVESGNTILSTDAQGALFDKNKTILYAFPIANTSTTYTVPSTVTQLDYDAFWLCNNLTKVVLPENLKTIGGWAMAGCGNLKEVIIPSKVTTIDDYAFYSSTSLKSVTSEIMYPFEIKNYVFYGIDSDAVLYVPSGRKSAYQTTGGWNVFKTIIERGGSNTGTFVNGRLEMTLNQAGGLQTFISSKVTPSAIRELVITGSLNGDDIRYIRQLAGRNYSDVAVTSYLETLDLENADIVSGGNYYKAPAYSTSDNVIGLSMFADTKLKFISLPKTATTIMSQAFGNCKQLIGVTVHDKVTSIPSNLFNDCSALCYIDWKPTRSLTSGMLPTSSTRNPNLLLYVTSSSYAPYTTPNVVIGSVATKVTLTNGYAFWAPREFTANDISYSRSFTKTTGSGSAQGWETITLPFQPTKISHATKGELVPFGRWSGTSDTKKPFWLYGFGSSGFTASNYLYANQPYIIAMPNNTSYDDAYRVNGTVTFSATSATVKASLQAIGTTNGVRTLRPTYEAVAAAYDKYVLNANGSQFITYRAANPFEAYFTTTESNARGVIDIFEDLPTGMDMIPTVDTVDTPEKIYDLQGRKVATPQRGIYIKDGRKVIVK